MVTTNADRTAHSKKPEEMQPTEVCVHSKAGQKSRAGLRISDLLNGMPKKRTWWQQKSLSSLVACIINSIKASNQSCLALLICQLLNFPPVAKEATTWASNLNTEHRSIISTLYTWMSTYQVFYMSKTYFLFSAGAFFSVGWAAGSARMAAWTLVYISARPSASIPSFKRPLKCDWYFSGSSSFKSCIDNKLGIKTFPSQQNK